MPKLSATAALFVTFALVGCSEVRDYGSTGSNKDTSKTGPSKSRQSASSGKVGAKVGDIAFDFSLPDENGDQVALSDFRGKVVVLDFWATWCPPCRKEIPGFVQLQKKYPDDVAVVGVSLDQEGWKKVSPFMEQNDINYTIVLGDESVTRKYGGINGIPTTFVIDGEGVIRDVHVGYAEPAVFEKAVKAALADRT
jgi:cytochrome c biogenesis protein CcmG/thiol:disulfide interchange protein DsbE